MRRFLRVAGTVSLALLAQDASASDELAATVISSDVLCANTGTPIVDGIFRGLLAFGDRHGDIAVAEACSERVFGLNYRDSGLLDPENAELLAFLRRQALTDRFAAAIDIRADFEPSTTASPRYPGLLRVKQILAFRPTERRLFDVLESGEESEQAPSAPPSSSGSSPSDGRRPE